MTVRFADRADAGRRLAKDLAALAGRDDVLVLGLPRGGIPVAAVVAEALAVPLDVLVVRKLGAPGHRELAMGAVASGGVRFLHRGVLASLGISEPALAAAVAEAEAEVERGERTYRGRRPAPALGGSTVVLVDDGLATGSTMIAAVAAVRRLGAARVVAAVPVAPPEACNALGRVVDELVCALRPERFVAVGAFYEDFAQTSDAQVRALLDAARRRVCREACGH